MANLVRVYVPATLSVLASLHKSAEIAPTVAHAVTPALREWYAEGDDEELEFAAFTRAAQEALRLLGKDPEVGRRRAVISADVPATSVSALSQDLGTSHVKLTEAVPLSAVAAVHIDSAEAESDVAAAAQAAEAAAAGDSDAQFTVDSAEDHDLLWYAPEELSDLLA
jgi:hypothetical protein